jgi:hypothetical protein
MKHLLTLALLILPMPAWGQTMPHVLTPELRAKWPELSKAGNPLAIYGTFSLEGGPAWFAQRTIPVCYMAWLETGEQKYLDLACDDYLLMPDVTAGQGIVHLHEIYHARDYLLIKPHQSAAKNAEWERRLKALGNKMVAGVRSGNIDQQGDFDQCLTYLCYWKILDKFIGTDYLSQPSPKAAQAWVNKFMDPRAFKGGPRDASSAYEHSTLGLLCWGVAIVGKDVFPWFDDWAKQYAEWLPASVSADGKDGVAWGDQQGDDGGKVNNPVTACFLLAGLGYDTGGELRSLGKRLHPHKAELGRAVTVYPGGADALQFVVDPQKLYDAPILPAKDVLKVADGIGATVLRDSENFLQTHLANVVLRDGTWMETEDHHFRGGQAHYAWKYKGQRIVAQPYGYGIGGNEFFNLNALCLKSQGWFWARRFLGTEQTANGFVTSGEMWGPSQGLWQSTGPNRWTEFNAYDGCKVTSRIEYDRTGPLLIVRDDWTSPGDTFPSWTGELPVFQRCQHALGPIKDDGTALTWEVGGIAVRAAYTLTDGEGNAVKPTVVVEPEPRYLNSQNYWRAFIQSPPDLLNGSLELRIGPVVEPVPGPPPSTDVEIRGVIRTVNGKRELVVPLP